MGESGFFRNVVRVVTPTLLGVLVAAVPLAEGAPSAAAAPTSTVPAAVSADVPLHTEGIKVRPALRGLTSRQQPSASVWVTAVRTNSGAVGMQFFLSASKPYNIKNAKNVPVYRVTASAVWALCRTDGSRQAFFRFASTTLKKVGGKYVPNKLYSSAGYTADTPSRTVFLRRVPGDRSV